MGFCDATRRAMDAKNDHLPLLSGSDFCKIFSIKNMQKVEPAEDGFLRRHTTLPIIGYLSHHVRPPCMY